LFLGNWVETKKLKYSIENTIILDELVFLSLISMLLIVKEAPRPKA